MGKLNWRLVIDCINGIYVRETDSCLCAPDYTGPLCDQLDCECSGSRQCSANGACVRSAGPNSKPICKCNGIWEGTCCEVCPPVTSRTDPHLDTIDGASNCSTAINIVVCLMISLYYRFSVLIFWNWRVYQLLQCS